MRFVILLLWGMSLPLAAAEVQYAEYGVQGGKLTNKAPAPTLFHRWSDSRMGRAVVSEPLEADEADWLEVPPGSFCVFEGEAVTIRPFVVQPLQNAFEAIGDRPLEVAATLGASPWDTFWSVVVPLARPGFLSGAILGFAHTVGEFGVVLMIGGNIPDKTRVISMQIYNHVEALEFGQAHGLAAGLLVFSFVVLLGLYALGGNGGGTAGGRP